MAHVQREAMQTGFIVAFGFRLVPFAGGLFLTSADDHKRICSGTRQSSDDRRASELWRVPLQKQINLGVYHVQVPDWRRYCVVGDDEIAGARKERRRVDAH